MSKKDDMIATIKGNGDAEAVPIWELSFHLFDRFSDRPLVLGEEFRKLAGSEREKAIMSNAEILIKVSEKLHFAAVTLPGNYWEEAPGQPAYYIMPGGWMEMVEAVVKLRPDDLMLVVGAGGVMAMPDAVDYVDFCYKMFDAPEEIDERARKTFDESREWTKRMADIGVDIFMTASDIADNHGPFFKPDQMERWVLPYLRKFAEDAHRLGCYAILHSDGDLNMYLDEIADSGVDVLQAIDPIAGMNMKDSLDKVDGRIALAGNIDCGIMVAGTTEEVFEATKNLLVECKNSKRLILGASNALQKEVPRENYLAFIEAWEKFGMFQRPVG